MNITYDENIVTVIDTLNDIYTYIEIKHIYSIKLESNRFIIYYFNKNIINNKINNKELIIYETHFSNNLHESRNIWKHRYDIINNLVNIQPQRFFFLIDQYTNNNICNNIFNILDNTIHAYNDYYVNENNIVEYTLQQYLNAINLSDILVVVGNENTFYNIVQTYKKLNLNIPLGFIPTTTTSNKLANYISQTNNCSNPTYIDYLYYIMMGCKRQINVAKCNIGKNFQYYYSLTNQTYGFINSLFNNTNAVIHTNWINKFVNKLEQYLQASIELLYLNTFQATIKYLPYSKENKKFINCPEFNLTTTNIPNVKTISGEFILFSAYHNPTNQQQNNDNMFDLVIVKKNITRYELLKLIRLLQMNTFVIPNKYIDIIPVLAYDLDILLGHNLIHNNLIIDNTSFNEIQLSTRFDTPLPMIF